MRAPGQQRDADRERRATGARADSTELRSAREPAHGVDAVMALQRSVGNQAVTTMLAGERRAEAVHRNPVVQRAPNTRSAAKAAENAEVSGAATPAQVAAPDPVLTATVEAEGDEGLCGNFARRRRWKVANPVRGVIIQRVTRRFDVEKHDGDGVWTPLSGSALDDYVKDPNATVNAGDTAYWELWTVGPKGGFGQDGSLDTFALTSLIPAGDQVEDSTRGRFTMHGEARFYPTDVHPGALGFARRNVASAGGLFSRPDDPAADLQRNGVTAVGAAVTFGVTSSWNSASGQALSEDHPEGAWSTVVP
ncbi:hypothetical protein [Saccharothrix sp. NRRL B-16314]|uniref:hypothetical protein n=1 Tax=Saccharothrix sp. NRRL B-16314 TaxID=1463825 RepID=UPI00069028B6|nr:hypothetical protein [Saccharothrix sp. NRRL B-16314]